jgi:hypothetical protein
MEGYTKTPKPPKVKEAQLDPPLIPISELLPPSIEPHRGFPFHFILRNITHIELIHQRKFLEIYGNANLIGQMNWPYKHLIHNVGVKV